MATPPARNAFFGSPRILPEGKSAVTAEATGVGQVFGPSFAGGSATFERGLGDLREIVVTPTGGLIQDSSAFAGLSLDVKQGLPNTPHLSFAYGGGYLWNRTPRRYPGRPDCSPVSRTGISSRPCR